jgi:hypothetical protein
MSAPSEIKRDESRRSLDRQQGGKGTHAEHTTDCDGSKPGSEFGYNGGQCVGTTEGRGVNEQRGNDCCRFDGGRGEQLNDYGK